jgi:predicted dehydrogenase
LAPVRLGLIGVGRWGRNFVRTLGAGVEGAILAAVASSNPETAAILPPGCAMFTDWRAMLAEGHLDGVLIATPPALHADMTRAAMKAGLAVLVEKPLTLSLPPAYALRDLLWDHPVPIRVGHVHLFSSAWQGFKRQVRRLGPVSEIKGMAGNRGPYRADSDVLWDYGPHDVAFCLDLLGAMPDEASAKLLASRSMEDGLLAQRYRLRLGFGAIEAEMVIGTDMDKTRRFEAHCQGGTVLYDDTTPEKLFVDGRPVALHSPHFPLHLELLDFVAAIRANDTDPSDLDLGIRVVEVLDRCRSTLA